MISLQSMNYPFKNSHKHSILPSIQVKKLQRSRLASIDQLINIFKISIIQPLNIKLPHLPELSSLPSLIKLTIYIHRNPLILNFLRGIALPRGK